MMTIDIHQVRYFFFCNFHSFFFVRSTSLLARNSNNSIAMTRFDTVECGPKLSASSFEFPCSGRLSMTLDEQQKECWQHCCFIFQSYLNLNLTIICLEECNSFYFLHLLPRHYYKISRGSSFHALLSSSFRIILLSLFRQAMGALFSQQILSDEVEITVTLQ